MIFDLELQQPDQGAASGPWDVCIVGGGAAGIVLAVQLLAQGKRVLLLEGGGNEVEERSQEPYRSELAGLPHRGIHTGRVRAKGGTTTRWGGQILEFYPEDFVVRRAVPASGWPFPKDTLQAAYERALDLEGLHDVTRRDVDVWREIGVTPPDFAGFNPYFSRWCPEPAMARIHRQTLEEHHDLALWLHANAVEPRLAGDTLNSLRCRTLGGIEHVFHAARFIFCLGGIESCRFFLQPRAGGLPWNTSGLLGMHFQDHIDVTVADVEPLNRRRFHEIFDNVFSRGFKYHPKLRLAPAVQQREGTLNAAAAVFFEIGENEADDPVHRLKMTANKLRRGTVRAISAQDLTHLVRHLPLLFRQVYRFAVQHRGYNPPSTPIRIRVHCEQQPDSASRITLSDQRDTLGLLRTRLDWQISALELATIRACALQAQAALKGLATVTIDAHLLAGDPAFRHQCDDNNHHMGGMRMAIRPEEGIVDTDLRLHGTANCYICSPAVFPTSSFSNPTHTLLALAVRLAEHLR